jgi:hypothetical protein
MLTRTPAKASVILMRTPAGVVPTILNTTTMIMLPAAMSEGIDFDLLKKDLIVKLTREMIAF